MNAVIAIAQMMIKRTIGTPKGFFFLLVLPIAAIAGIIGVFGQNAGSLPRVAVLNADGGWLGGQVAASLQASPDFDIVLLPRNGHTADALRAEVYDGQWDAAVHIPDGFTATLTEGGEAALDMFRTNEQQWNVSLRLALEQETRRLSAAVEMAGRATDDERQREALVRQWLDRGDGGLTSVKERLLAGNDPSHIYVTGLLLLFLMMMVNQSISTVVEDRTNRTMARMFAAPVRAAHIAAGNFLGCLALGTLQLAVILAAARWALGFDFGMSYGEILIIMECFLLAAVGLSTAVAGAVRNPSSLGHMNNLVVVPTCMLGGCFWPIGMMPGFMQNLANFTPQRWAISAIGQTAGGGSLEAVGLQLGILLLFAAVLLGFGAFVLRPAGR